jgi:hypothetical protein
MTYFRTLINALPLALLLLFTACSEDRSAVKALQNDTERIHDEAMKDLAQMMAVNRAFRDKLAEKDLDPATRDLLLKGRSDMLKADAEMMKWMRDYHEPDEKMPKEEAIKYLEAQKAAIEQNQANIRAAMVKGKEVLEQLKVPK